MLPPKWQPFCTGLNMPNTKTWKCKTNSGECMLTTPKRVCTYLHDHRRSSDDWSYKKIRRWFNSLRSIVMLYGDINLGQHWLRLWLVPWQHPAIISWNHVELSSKVFCGTELRAISQEVLINPLWPSDAIWRHRSGSTLAQVMACCLMAPSHYLNQCWLIISEVQWHSY